MRLASAPSVESIILWTKRSNLFTRKLPGLEIFPDEPFHFLLLGAGRLRISLIISGPVTIAMVKATCHLARSAQLDPKLTSNLHSYLTDHRLITACRRLTILLLNIPCHRTKFRCHADFRRARRGPELLQTRSNPDGTSPSGFSPLPIPSARLLRANSGNSSFSPFGFYVILPLFAVILPSRSRVVLAPFAQKLTR